MVEFSEEKHYHGPPCGKCSGTLRYRRGRKGCVSCARRRATSWNVANPDRLRAKNLMYSYGITPVEYDKILEDQSGVCAICGEQCSCRGRLAVDHDHRTGVVRGLLCNNCNRSLGLLKDSREVLLSAVAYLDKHRDAAAPQPPATVL